MVQSLEWWLFIVVGVLIYWLLPMRWRPWLMGIGSLGYLISEAPFDILIMLVLSLGCYWAYAYAASAERVTAIAGADSGAAVSLRIVLLPLAAVGRSPWPVIIVLTYLFLIKYAPTMAAVFSLKISIWDAMIPIGISYFSFKLIHYGIERRRGNFPEHNLGDFLAWLFLLPIFSAGPIERFEHFLEHRQAQFKSEFVIEGITRICQGLVKKFVIAAVILTLMEKLAGGSVSTFVAHVGEFSTALVWAYLFLSLAYFYFDFSAYSDIAIGASRLFGLRIMENFNFPYLSTSLADFWRRWHMTLANFCRGYIYMSLIGLTRNPHVAIIVTFGLLGVWHAASSAWLLWGLWNGFGLSFLLFWSRFAAKRKIKFFKTKIGQLTGWALTMAFVALGEGFTLAYPDGGLGDSFRILAKAFGMNL